MWVEIFTKNIDLVFFIYGLAFVAMGIAILIHPRIKESFFKIGDIIWLLAAFGLSHGVNEWLDMLHITKGYSGDLWDMAQLIVLVLSYLFLFEFGRRLLILSFHKLIGKWTTVVICFIIFILAGISKEGLKILPRYLLGFPGGLFAAFGFFTYYLRNETILKPLNLRSYFFTAAVAMGIYGILGGLVTPKAGFFPASVINNSSFLNLVGIPVQVFRAICAILLAWSVWHILSIFNWEIMQKLKENLDQMRLAKTYVDNIIESITDSLLVIGPDAKVIRTNIAAQQFLGYKKDELLGLPFSAIFKERKTEEVLNEIEESAIILSMDFKIVAANKTFLNSVGLTKEKVVGQHCYKVTHNLDHICSPPQDRCPVVGLGKEGEPCVELHTHIDKEGNKFLVSVTAAPIKDSSGKILYYLHLTKNVPESESQKGISADYIKTVQLLTKLLLYTMDVSKVRSIFDKDTLREFQEMGAVKNLEVYCQAKSGEKIPVNISISYVTDKEGRLEDLVCVAKDIRDLKRLMQEEKEAVVAKTAAMIERRKAQEIAGLYNALQKSHAELKAMQSQLIHAEKMRVVGSLASGVAHEVKNPLAIIMQGIEYLSQKVGKDNQNIVMVLNNIDDAIKRADGIIKGLLDFSSLSALNIREENLNSVIDKALDLVKYQCDKYHIEIIRELGRDIPLVRIDRNRIEQVFVNIFLNALYAMPDGGRLTVRTSLEQVTNLGDGIGRRKDDIFRQGDMVVVAEIEDSGKGIPEEIMGKIFDPFFTTRRQQGGTGLGLAIVKNIIELHKGRIEIENKKEGGVRARLIFKSA